MTPDDAAVGDVVTMRTKINAAAVVFTVVDVDGREVWRRVVHFGQRDRNVAGGAAFTAAAREQADVALSVVSGAL